MFQCCIWCHWGLQLVPASSHWWQAAFCHYNTAGEETDSRRNAPPVLHWHSGMMHEDYSHLYLDLIQPRHSGVLRDTDKWMRKCHVAFDTCFLSWPQRLVKGWAKKKKMEFLQHYKPRTLLSTSTLVTKWSLVRFWDQPALQYNYRCTALHPIQFGGMTVFNKQCLKKHHKCSPCNICAIFQVQSNIKCHSVSHIKLNKWNYYELKASLELKYYQRIISAEVICIFSV